MIHLLDTSIFRLLGRSREELPQRNERNVLEWFEKVDARSLRISVLTLQEVRKGIELLRLKKGKPAVAAEIRKRLDRLLGDYGASFTVPVDEQVAGEWGRLSAEKDSDRMDMGIAATARVRGYVLVTRNMKDFRGRGITLLNPAVMPWTVVPADARPADQPL